MHQQSIPHYALTLSHRVFMVVLPEGQFVTARGHPKLVLIQPIIKGTKLTLSAPNMPAITIDIEKMSKSATAITTIWQQPVTSIDCGEDVAMWLSRFIIGEDIGLRLVFYPDSKPTRPVLSEYSQFKELTAIDTVQESMKFV